ncbi:response regulator [Trinickia acidisoli]|uniref:response regulator n=1 Tax=Trinickia acidisoli TaxID=2767482 RepID=UPI001A8CA13F|nr:response regulator [Trinickia acidisoli]
MNEPCAIEAKPPMILFIDDEATAVKYFQRAIGNLAPVLAGGSVEEGKALLDAHSDRVAVLVSDQRMPGECGNELLRYASERYPHVVRILTTAYSEIDQTIEAVNHGQIHRYIKKPWDITALRLELRQALELAGLRKERDQLVREKLTVLQRQTIATRIAVIRTVAASLIGPERFQPVETYLACAALAGVHAPELDWLLMDYADLVEAESLRGGAFGYRVANHLTALRTRGTGPREGQATIVLAELLEAAGGAVRREADTLIWGDPAGFAEFLGASTNTAVSAPHAVWMATLLWLDENGLALAAAKEGEVIVLRPTIPAAEWGGDRLATWIEHFRV